MRNAVVPFAEWPYPTTDEESHLVCSNVELLRARIDMLIEERAVKFKEEKTLEADFEFPLKWIKALSPQERRLVMAIVVASSRSPNTFAYTDNLFGCIAPEGKDAAEYSRRSIHGTCVVAVLVCKVRKKLKALLGAGAHIETIWGEGYKASATLTEALRKR